MWCGLYWQWGEKNEIIDQERENIINDRKVGDKYGGRRVGLKKWKEMVEGSKEKMKDKK